MKTIKLYPLFLLLLSSFTFLSATTKAQSAETNQLGLRLGGFSGFTFRHVGSRDVGVQVDLLENYHGYWALISVMAEKHIPLKEGFVLYFGGGAFLGGNHDPYYVHNEDHYWAPTLGLQGTVGVDYYFHNVPLNLGLDLTPRFSFYYDPFPWDGGISLRYIF